MKYNPSVNIETGISKDFQYVVTPNVQTVLGKIVSEYQTGSHSFTIIGTYGTGKSSFLMVLERDLQTSSKVLIGQNNLFNPEISDYEFLNILGDYSPLAHLLGQKIGCLDCDNSKNVISALNHLYKQVSKKNKLLVIVVDEFGKVLEHASKHNPEKELYFLQQLAEFCNDHNKNILLLTTLHQNFGTYAQKLTETQRQEWNKVKGRFKDVVFSEPVEQLLYMASKKIGESSHEIIDLKSLNTLLVLAKKSNFVSNNFTDTIAKNLYPLDPFAATCLTKSIQRYGQNERTLFSFLYAKGEGSFEDYTPSKHENYNLAMVYDYITYTFYSTLAEANADSMNWSAIREALDRVESGIFGNKEIENARRLVKTIGLLNLFGGSSVSIDKDTLLQYAQLSLNITSPEKILEKLEQFKVVRFAAYKKQYILFEGTDIDIENALLIAESKIAKPTANILELGEYIETRVISAVAAYYKYGTPRYFQYVAGNMPSILQPKDDVDGYIQLIFPIANLPIEKVIEVSKTNPNANIYVYFNNVEDIVKHLHQIKKLQYLLDTVVLEDRVAKREVNNLLDFEKHLLNNTINTGIVSGEKVTWIFNGKIVPVNSQGALKKLLTQVCEKVYYKTPVLLNELMNRQKLSSAISLARVNFLDAILNHSSEAELGFDLNSFPPEKTIYYSLLKNTGIHKLMNGSKDVYELSEPTNGILDLWEASTNFLHSALDKPKKVSDLIKILKEAPYKLKQGVIDFWIPTFLFIKQQDFAMYNGDGVFVMKINKEVFELLQKRPNDFSIKSFEMEGVKIEYFHQYRKLLKDTSPEDAMSSKTFIQTIKPFLGFYRGLNEYAKNTQKFDHLETARFRDVLARAKDPEKAFFVDLPEALGLSHEELLQGEELTNKVKMAMNELRLCYDLFINRIENCVIDTLGLPSVFVNYKEELENRYQYVKTNLLTQKSKVFLERVLAPSSNKKEFWEKVSNAVLDKRLEQTSDKEEEKLIDEILFLFRELDHYVDISKLDNFMTNDEAYSFELATTISSTHKQQTYRLSANDIDKAEKIEKQIDLSL